MDIQYSAEGSGGKNLLVKISGDCDMYNAQEFLNAITEKIQLGCFNIYLDFSGVIYLDSSGVGAIIKIVRLSKEKRVNLKFRGISGTPRKVLRMSNILSLLEET